MNASHSQTRIVAIPDSPLTQYFKRSYDKSTAQMARHFYHDKFPLETCISNAISHFITKWQGVYNV